MRVRLAAVVVTGLLVACGGDDDDATPTSTTSAAATVSTLGPVPDIGTGPDSALLFLAGVPDGILDLEITSCTIDVDAESAGEVVAELLAVAASGETDDGTRIDLDVRRYRSQGAATTITDTVTVTFGEPDSPDRSLVAQRFEVGGRVSDLRDPDADDPLLVIGPGGFEGRGLFAPPGADDEDDGRVEGLVRGSCA